MALICFHFILKYIITLIFCSYFTFFSGVHVYKLKYRVNRTNHKNQRRRDLLKVDMNQTKQLKKKHQASEENER